jgi:hypothetical protein
MIYDEMRQVFCPLTVEGNVILSIIILLLFILSILSFGATEVLFVFILHWRNNWKVQPLMVEKPNWNSGWENRSLTLDKG